MRPVRLAVVALALVAFALVVSCGEKDAGGVRYHCPMHPTYVSDKPGDCPICGMRLVPIGDKGAGNAPAASVEYACPMHPEVVSDAPGKCPKCGMDLVPKEEPSPAGERKVRFYRSPMDPNVTSPVPAKDAMGMDFVPVYEDEAGPTTGAAVEGRATVSATDEGLRLAGVRAAVATREAFGGTLRVVGTVAFDETRVRRVTVKVGGYVERLFVDFTGRPVKAGEPVLAMYSPELLAAQEEYLRAREAARALGASALPEARAGADDLLSAARRRLELLDVPAPLVAELDRTGRARRAVTFAAPVSGVVTAKGVFEGQRIEPGTELFTVADLSRVWIEAAVYEDEARSVRVGQAATIALPSDPGATLSAKVAFVGPTVDPASRTLGVRFEFANPGMALRPGTFVNVDLLRSADEGVVVPDSAVMDTGTRKLVYVETAPGTFVPREVVVGARGGGKARIVSGVAAGERVVAEGNFLLDSESRLRAAIGGSSAPEPARAASPGETR